MTNELKQQQGKTKYLTQISIYSSLHVQQDINTALLNRFLRYKNKQIIIISSKKAFKYCSIHH